MPVKDRKHRAETRRRAEAGNSTRSALFVFWSAAATSWPWHWTLIATVRIGFHLHRFSPTPSMSRRTSPAAWNTWTRGSTNSSRSTRRWPAWPWRWAPTWQAFALPAFLHHGPFEMNDEGLTVLYHEHRYDRNLALRAPGHPAVLLGGLLRDLSMGKAAGSTRL